MYLIVIAWIYVVLMMAVAEATNATGSVLGAIVTFLLYGVGPAGLVAYLMSAPARGRRNKQRLQEAELAFAQQKNTAAAAVNPSGDPDAGGHAPGGADGGADGAAGPAEPGASIPAVRKIP